MKAGRVAGGAIIFVSVTLMTFLSRWEGENQYVVYADKLAGGLPTVCRGLTRHVTSTPIIVGEVWSKQKCLEEEIAALEKVQAELARCFRLTPPQSVFDAASSHAWNFGSPATCSSQAMTAWNFGMWELGCRRLHESDDGRPVWSYVKTGEYINGKPVYKFIQGLHNRRKAETALCFGSGQP